jgi:GTP cyclohydrolase IA
MKDELILTKVNGKINGSAGINGNGKRTIEIQDFELFGDNHIGTSVDTPMRDDAFDISDDEKMAIIEDKFRDIMETMGLDLSDDSLRGTPHRVAKMFIKEIFYGLNPANKPKISVFENKFKYNEMLVEKEHQHELYLRAPLFAHCWESACGVHFEWRSNWIEQD